MKRILVTSLSLLALWSSAAHAHFLWAQTDPQNGQIALYFGEGGEGFTVDVDPERLRTAALWKPSGEKLSPTLSRAAFRAPLVAEVPVYGAHQSWGVLDRTQSGRGVFRLEYFAKAAIALDQAGWSARLPVELFARRDQQGALVTFKRDGKIVSNAEVTVVTPQDEKGRKHLTDAQGQIRFPLSGAGLYALRAVAIDPTPGTHNGQPYPQTRFWSTLTFHVGEAPQRLAAVNLDAALAPRGANPDADPRAYALLRAANGNRQVMPESFAGFEADLLYNDGATSKTGRLLYRRQGQTEIQIEGLSEVDRAWLQDKVLNLIGHRRGGNFDEGDGRHPLSFVEGDQNEFGQLIKLNDRMNSQYRIKDGRVTEVTRTAGNTVFTISVMETIEADPGKYLANHFSVAYRDKESGAMTRFEGYRDSYAKMDGVWLPTGRLVMDFGADPTPRVRSFRLRNFSF